MSYSNLNGTDLIITTMDGKTSYSDSRSLGMASPILSVQEGNKPNSEKKSYTISLPLVEQAVVSVRDYIYTGNYNSQCAYELYLKLQKLQTILKFRI